MSCCNDHRNCRQGRDCPARQERIERIRKLAKDNRVRNEILEVLALLVLAALILFDIWLGSIYHQAIRSAS